MTTSTPATLVAVVGNPKPASRTASAAAAVCERWVAMGRHSSYAVIDLGAGDGEPGVAGPGGLSAIEQVEAASEVLFATPTYRGTFTGLLKLFLDQLPSGALAGKFAYTLMTAASPLHAMGGDGDLQRVMHELRGATPVPNMFVPEQALGSGEWIDTWLETWEWALPGLVARPSGS